jgi:4-amino-4-deoxy-L-arabinose transferase-like glycosyltransferase
MEEMLMGQIPSYMSVVVALVIVFLAAMLAQQKWGSKALKWVWITSAVVITGAILSWAFYKYGLPSAQELFQHRFRLAFLVIYLFSGVLLASDGVIWLVTVLGPRPPRTPLNEVSKAVGIYYALSWLRQLVIQKITHTQEPANDVR